ncbi:transposable element Tcb1 transposase [Trichonephila clavipes]|nr:transposable element Tcb1 transposase [Trichonephila clavipes]
MEINSSGGEAGRVVGAYWRVQTDPCGLSHPLQFTTSREDRQIVSMAVTDHSVTLRAVAQHIECETHNSVYVRTILRRLKQSGIFARRPVLGLPLTHNHRCLRRQWCDERRMWAAEYIENVITDESRICLQHHDVRIAGTLNSQRYISKVLMPVVLPYLQDLTTAIFQQDNTRPHVVRLVQRFFSHQIHSKTFLAVSPGLATVGATSPRFDHDRFRRCCRMLPISYPQSPLA